MRMFITSKNKYVLNDMKIFGTCSIPLISRCASVLQNSSKSVMAKAFMTGMKAYKKNKKITTWHNFFPI